MTKRVLWWLCLLMYCALPGRLLAATSVTTVTTFPIPDGSLINYAGINDSGAVVFTTTQDHSYLRREDGTIVQIAFPGATKGTSVRDINNSGQIVGMYYTEKSGYGFLRQPDGTFVDLAPL